MRTRCVRSSVLPRLHPPEEADTGDTHEEENDRARRRHHRRHQGQQEDAPARYHRQLIRSREVTGGLWQEESKSESRAGNDSRYGLTRTFLPGSFFYSVIPEALSASERLSGIQNLA